MRRLLLIAAAVLLLAGQGWAATTVIRYVDPNSAACTGANCGTTNALSSADNTHAYPSLFAWEAARQRNLVTADEIERVICSSDDAGSTHAADTTGVTIDGWTTDATRYIQIEAASSHGGKWNESIYRRDGAARLQIGESFVNVIGIQIRITSAATRSLFINGAGVNGTINISNCYLESSGSGSSHILDVYSIAATTVNVYNTISVNVTGSGRYAFYVNDADATVNLYNCTGINKYNNSTSRTFMVDAGTMNLANCLGVASGTSPAFYKAAAATVSASYCASDDATADDWGGSGNRINQAFTFVDEANNDFHLASDDGGARDFGVSDPGSGLYSDDIDGVTRTGTWDIGADEYVAAGGSAIKAVLGLAKAFVKTVNGLAIGSVKSINGLQ